MTRSLLPLLILFLGGQPGCIWKLWSKGPPLEERVFDLYGTVESIDSGELVIRTRREEQSFEMGPASIKGSDFEPGSYVHVYYKLKGETREVTMVVEKID